MSGVSLMVLATSHYLVIISYNCYCQVSLVAESDLERVSKSYEKILSRHIYSVQKNPTITSTG